MIALIILGLGLLFIAAALPVGLDYTRQTVDRATGEAAAQHALKQLELNLRTAKDLYDPDLGRLTPPVIRRLDNIHRPRNYAPPQIGQPLGTYPLNELHEPLFKVRPLTTGNLRAGPADGATREIADNVEATITNYLRALGLTIPAAPLETDLDLGSGLSLAENPVLPALARVYPPVAPATVFSVEAFFGDQVQYPQYDARFRKLEYEVLEREREKALDRRVGWTAFYRRVSYRLVDPDSPPNIDGDEYLEAPLTYELIVVVTRRPTVNHRFPRQRLNLALADFEQPAALSPADPPPDDHLPALGYGFGTDRLAPTPWLVIFDRNATDALPLCTREYAGVDRTLTAGTDPATLTFRCTREVGALLPVGSIFLPAWNDARYLSILMGMDARVSGFVPHAPEALPIYTVVERPDETTVVVENNGYYPWVASGDPQDTQAWPVWIIPPPFVERDASGQPIYERTSPIVAVVRRTVTLHEMP